MNIQKADYTETTIKKSIETVENLVRNLMVDVIKKYGGEKANNILKGTLIKYIARFNIFLINLNLLKEFIENPEKIQEMANKFTFIEKEISRDYFVISRLDFFIGIFSLFEDAISNNLSSFLFTSAELDGMGASEYKKLLEKEDVNILIKDKCPKLHKKLLKVSEFIPIDTFIRKLRSKRMISKD